MMPESIARFIDHAVLHPTQTDDDLRAACALCVELGTASVCVKPYMLPLATELLAGSPVVPCTVIGFPHGSPTSRVKAAEATQACLDGAKELDMVINIGRALGGRLAEVGDDIRAVVEAGKEHGALIKVIFETGLIESDDLKRQLCKVTEEAGADFVKTSTGFGFVARKEGGMQSTGATEHDIALMRSSCSIGVKASGGIRSLADARRYIELGATRLGTSSTKLICEQEKGIADAEKQGAGY
jgi:deoxyribose-phosphate aldolase